MKTYAVPVFFLVFLLFACQAAPRAGIDTTDSPLPVKDAASTSPSATPPSMTSTAERPHPAEPDPTPALTESTAGMKPGANPSLPSDAALIGGVDWYILIENQASEVLLAKNEHEAFQPASMIKIPIAMAVLKILQDQGKSLQDLHSVGVSGKNFAGLLEAMVVVSDEHATDALEFFARGGDLLRRTLDNWGLQQTTFDPRRSTASDLMLSLRLLEGESALNQEFTDFLLELMGTYSENDHLFLGRVNSTLPECQFLNKRGTLLNPTVAADMGILTCGEQTWFFVVAGTPAAGSSVTFEDIQASIEAFAVDFANFIDDSP